MKYVYAVSLLVLAIAWAGAVLTLQHPETPGVTRLTWGTDPNPARDVQAATFHMVYPDLEIAVESGNRDRVVVACATGTGPDLIDGMGEELREAGLLLDITDAARRMGFSPDKTYPAVRSELMSGGRQYQFPCNVWTFAVVYNRSVFDKLGLAYPKTPWDYKDLIALSQQIRQRGRNRYIPVAMLPSDWYFPDLLVGCHATQFTHGGLICTLDSPQAIEAMQLYHDLIFVHHVLPTPEESSGLSSQGGWGSGAINWFSNGKAAMLFIGRWYLCQLPNYPGLAPQLGAVECPGIHGRPSRTLIRARSVGINVRTTHPQAALKFLQYLAGPEYSRLIIADGDGLPPAREYVRTGKDLVNRIMPDPAFHQPFLDGVQHATSLEPSPYINMGLVGRWVTERIGMVENRMLTPEAAMRGLAEEINRRIRRNLARRPDLQRRYRQQTGRVYEPDWWKHLTGTTPAPPASSAGSTPRETSGSAP